MKKLTDFPWLPASWWIGACPYAVRQRHNRWFTASERQPAAAAKGKRRRMRRAYGFDRIVERMHKALDEGEITKEQLLAMKVDDLPARFTGSRTPCWKARKQVLAELARAHTPLRPASPG